MGSRVGLARRVAHLGITGACAIAFVTCVASAVAPPAGTAGRGPHGLDESALQGALRDRAPAVADLYATACAPCHGKAGGGQVGPSFLDDEWLHGAGLEDVRRTIRLGVDGTAMPPWRDTLSPGDILHLAEHVRSLAPLVAAQGTR